MKTATKRTTIYFDPDLHRALRVKAAQTEQSFFNLVNAAVKLSLVEDAENFTSIEARRAEPDLFFEEVLKDLKQGGKISAVYQTLSRSRTCSHPVAKRPPAPGGANQPAC